MKLSKTTADSIIQISSAYLGRQFDLKLFNCVHFVIEVYEKAGIELPLLDRYGNPPGEFHVSEEELMSMPIGRSVFFKRKAKDTARLWTHMAIIYSQDTLIHCTRHMGDGVVLTPKSAFLEMYNLSPLAH